MAFQTEGNSACALRLFEHLGIAVSFHGCHFEEDRELLSPGQSLKTQLVASLGQVLAAVLAESPPLAVSQLSWDRPVQISDKWGVKGLRKRYSHHHLLSLRLRAFHLSFLMASISLLASHTQRKVYQTVRCRLSAIIRERGVARMIPSCQPRLGEGEVGKRVCRGSHRLPCNVPPLALHASSPPLLLPKFLSLNSLRHSLQKATDSCCNGLDRTCLMPALQIHLLSP